MATIAFNPKKGAPPSIEFKAVSELEVDHSYQRSAEDGASRALITGIARDWDWRLCAPLTVARRDGRFYVIDGQHRLEAAKLRGDVEFLPCIVSTFDTMAEEARCFIGVNTRRRQVSALETFKAELAAGDERAKRVNLVIAEAGLAVAAHSNPTAWKPMQISAIAGVRAALSRYGEVATRAALQDVAKAFPDQVLRYSGRILQALYAIHGDPRRKVDQDKMQKALARRDQSGWYSAMLRRQAKHGELPDSAMSYAILELYETTDPAKAPAKEDK